MSTYGLPWYNKTFGNFWDPPTRSRFPVVFLASRVNYELTPNLHFALQVPHANLPVLVLKFWFIAVKILLSFFPSVLNLKKSTSTASLSSLTNVSFSFQPTFGRRTSGHWKGIFREENFCISSPRAFHNPLSLLLSFSLSLPYGLNGKLCKYLKVR
jgi:hypothetical protein